MIMHINQSLILLLSSLSFLCIKHVAFAQLHPDEVVVLAQIVTTLGAIHTNSTDDPCRSGKLSITANLTEKNIVGCKYTDGSFSHVTNLILKGMSLQGRLPPELVNLTFLEEIDLTRNYLSGELPKEWASMQYLRRMSLEANQLSGTIPKELGKLVTVTELILSSNQFVGSLPTTLANLNLTDFRISDNSFDGTVPEFIGRWTKLKRLEMYSSGLKGPINQTIFVLGQLTDLRLTDMLGPKFDFPKMINRNMEKLVLRSLNMSGSILPDIMYMSDLKMLDLSFNKLEGEITSGITKPKYIFLSGNMLTGPVPDSFLNKAKNVDLSYNNFTLPDSCPKSSASLNMHRSFSWEKNMSGLISCPSRSGCQKYYQSMHINCGGPSVTINHTKYEGDDVVQNEAISNYDSKTNWGFISAGDFMDNDDDGNKQGNIVSVDAQAQPEKKLYSTARASALFLTYYGYCLKNGNYTVNLHFAEILFKDEESYHRVGRCIFDIYIQGIRRWKDFNIKEQANGTGKAIIRSFNATVTDNTPDIRLYWAGKGTTCIPSRGNYGPLISAISVCWEF